MRLLTAIVCHNRLELTRLCVESYLATITVPFRLVIVDNASADDTRVFLCDLLKRDPVVLGDVEVHFSHSNDYPGRACNRAWNHAIGLEENYFGKPPFSHLHRSDNDVEYLPGWCDEIARVFSGDGLCVCSDDTERCPDGVRCEANAVGQVGLLEERYEQGCFNVGGNSVIRREVWDAGVRWAEQRWAEHDGNGPLATEDTFMSTDVARLGYQVRRVAREAIVHHGWDWDQYPEYYKQTASERGYQPDWLHGHFDRMKSL